MSDDDMPMAPVIEPAAIVEQDDTEVVLRIQVGYVFDVLGTLDLHESGKVTLVPRAADDMRTLRGGYIMCWRGDESRPPADILRELPRRWKTYLWAGIVFDHTAAATADTMLTRLQAENMRLWLRHQIQVLGLDQERQQQHQGQNRDSDTTTDSTDPWPGDDPAYDPTALESRGFGEEIDLSPEEEAALDRAWERTRRWEALRRQQQQGGNDTAATTDDTEPGE